MFQELGNVIETAYQDMRGLMDGRKNYRLRHRELSNRIIDIFYSYIEKWDDEEYISVDELKAELKGMKER